ncbi:nucleotide pyrophosphohydrolase [Maricurvus nonylphenolicus]|uniref:nucleotide pyrophosphohydrolase n=1 Tax=Maricurvus nonylphenolicus TaxID=1008307 RepID=UPI0036F1DEFD
MDCDKILQEFNAIADLNGWHKKHSAKNLAAAISVEAAELLAEVQWLSDAESEALVEQPDKIGAIGAEAADITMYLLALCDKLNIDLATAIEQKQQQNRARFGPK